MFTLQTVTVRPHRGHYNHLFLSFFLSLSRYLHLLPCLGLTSSKFLSLNQSLSQHQWNFSVLMSLAVDIQHNIAKLSPAQSNSNSVGWVEIALISAFTHSPAPPPHSSRLGNKLGLSLAQLSPSLFPSLDESQSHHLQSIKVLLSHLATKPNKTV